MNIFVDESGEMGFNANSSTHYVITCLCPSNSKLISNRFKRYHANLISLGWPQDIEPKATTMFSSSKNRDIPSSFKYKSDPIPLMTSFLGGLATQDLEIDAIVVNKSNIDEHLKKAPLGILHNYYSSKILVPRVCMYDSVHLFVDRRTKERHPQLKFDGYLETKVLEQRVGWSYFQIMHEDSKKVRGLSTVDYISWAIFRLFEFNDSRFFDCFVGKIKNFKKWYFE